MADKSLPIAFTPEFKDGATDYAAMLTETLGEPSKH